MDDIHKHKNMDELRRRLYARDAVEAKNERHSLTDEKVDVSRNWNVATPPVADTTKPAVPVEAATEPEQTKAKRTYRSIILIGSLLVFIVGAGISAFMILFGGNAITSDNISLAITGPTTLAGGDVLSLQVGVANQNAVAIDSATLVLKYPTGTRTANDSERNLYEERIPISGVVPGEVRNIPVRIVVFGEEGEEKQVTATLEYRIDGSNGTFYKDADPLAFRITSTPLVLRVEHLEKVSSGQQVDTKVIVQSNSPNPIKNLLIRAEYPNGFDYVRSAPDPVYGENVWRIDELAPEQSVEILIKGIVTGQTEESQRINFIAGPAESANQFVMASKIAEGRADFVIERPFIDVSVAINKDTSETVILPPNKEAEVEIEVQNTLDETVYDLVVEVVPGGTALRTDSITSRNGFYDSNSGIIRWEVANNESFAEVFPGQKRKISFTVSPQTSQGTASFDLVVNIYARRVAEQNAQEQLVGTVRTEAKYSSVINVDGQAGFVSGPVPPRVGQETTYSITLVAEAGANDVTGAIVTTGLPVHATWLDDVQGDGTIDYNSVSKQIEWNVGDITARKRKEVRFTVSLLPSASQSGTTPVLVNGQQMRGNDRFSGALLQASAPAITAELSTEAGYAEKNGVVTN